MTSRPILFSATMVRTLLDGTKTQTRRVCNPQPIRVDGGVPSRAPPPSLIGIADPVYGIAYNCPYGKQRDQLWARETWYCDDFRVQRGPYLKPDDFDVEEAQRLGHLVYRADDENPYEAEQPSWKPSIFMPRWASRITLEITSVRVERLQDISEADALAEGCVSSINLQGGRFANENYCHLWETINGDDSWDANPWVWVIEFKKVKP